MKICYIYCLTFLLFFTDDLRSQSVTQTIRGKVVDSQSEAPLTGATVLLEGEDLAKGAVTNSDGEYIISGIAVGRHKIIVSYVGYKPYSISQLLVSGKELILNIKLSESFSILKGVIVSAQSKSTDALNELATVSARSFHVEETNRFAATFDDPARAALSFAGVTGGGDDGMNEIVIRGNSPRGLLWRVEGMEIPNPNHFAEGGSSSGGTSMLSANMLDKSDFFTGAFPAEYGNALSGVFDLNFRNGNNKKREYSAEASLLGLALSAEGPFKKDSKASYLLNYRYSTLGVFENLGVSFLEEGESFLFEDYAFKVNLPSRKHGIFSIWGMGGASKSVEKEGEVMLEQLDTRLNAFGLNHRIYLSQNTYLQSKLLYSRHSTRLKEDSLGLKPFLTNDLFNSALRGSVLLNTKLSAKQTLRAGFILSNLGYDLFSEEWQQPKTAYFTNIDGNGQSSTLQSFVQWSYKPLEALTINTGLHYSSFFLNGNKNIEPRLGLKWQINNEQTLSAGYGIHSRLESLSFYLSNWENNGVLLPQANKNLKASKASHFVLGFENQFNSSLNLKAEVYLQELSNIPVFSNSYGELSNPSYSAINQNFGFINYPSTNEGTAENYGLDISLEKSFTQNYYFLITGSLFNSSYSGADRVERNSLFNAGFINNITVGKEYHVGANKNNLITLNLRSFWSGNNRVTPIDLAASQASLNSVFIYEDAYLESLPNYWRLDFGFSYRKNKSNRSNLLSLNIQNITNRLNARNHFYNTKTNQIEFDKQLGMFPNISYKVEF